MAKGPIRRAFWVLGILVLVGSAVGATWVINRPDTGAQEGTKPGAAAADANTIPGIIAFGYVDAKSGVRQLYPLQPGRVVWAVPEGKLCETGEVVLQLDDAIAKFDVEQAKAALEDAESKYEQAKKLPSQYQDKINAQTAVIEDAADQVKLAEKYLALRKGLKDLGTPILGYEIEAGELRVSAAKAALKAEKAKLSGLEKDSPDWAVNVARANVDAKKAQLDKAEKVVDECKVRVPVKGTVLRVQTATGELASPQSPRVPVEFCPEEQRVVRTEVLQDWAGKVKAGQKCVIEDESISGPRWEGTVTRVSDWFTQKRSIIQEPFQMNDVRTLECLVSIDGGEHPLRIGQRLRVTILQGGP